MVIGRLIGLSRPYVQQGLSKSEKLLYGAIGTFSGIAGSKTSRDLQDYYVNRAKPSNRIFKRRFKGDVVIESSNTQSKALRPKFKRRRVYGVKSVNYTRYKRRKYCCKPCKRSRRRFYG